MFSTILYSPIGTPTTELTPIATKTTTTVTSPETGKADYLVHVPNSESLILHNLILEDFQLLHSIWIAYKLFIFQN